MMEYFATTESIFKELMDQLSNSKATLLLNKMTPIRRLVSLNKLMNSRSCQKYLIPKRSMKFHILSLKFIGEKKHARIAKEILPKRCGKGTNHTRY